MKILKILAWILLIAFIIIQFIPSDLNDEAIDNGKKITQIYDVPAEVQQVLKTSCYDCHSNKTEYPWYNKIQPVAMYLENHIKDGKKHLNYDEFGDYDLKKQDHKLEETAEMVENGEMPLDSYTLIHTDAKLSEKDRQLLLDWVKDLRESM